jgi:hypothetical protein
MSCVSPYVLRYLSPTWLSGLHWLQDWALGFGGVLARRGRSNLSGQASSGQALSGRAFSGQAWGATLKGVGAKRSGTWLEKRKGAGFLACALFLRYISRIAFWQGTGKDS